MLLALFEMNVMQLTHLTSMYAIRLYITELILRLEVDAYFHYCVYL